MHNITKRSHSIRQNYKIKRNNRHICSLYDLSITLKQSGTHAMALSRLVTHSIFALRNLDTNADNSMIELTVVMMHHFVQGARLNMFFVLMLIQ